MSSVTFLCECAVFLGHCSWRTLQRWTACLLCFFARMRGLLGCCSWRTLQRCTVCLSVFLRECAVFLGCCSWRTLQRWTACLLCLFARMRGLFGALQLANFAAMDCLPVMFLCANAQSFWGVAADELCSDGLPACYVFLCECAVFLGCCNWRTLQ